MDTANYKQSSEDYLRIEQAILYLENHYKDQPSLEEVAANIGLSEYHFQRLFTLWAGVSPKRFLQLLTKEGAKDLATCCLNDRAPVRPTEPIPNPRRFP